MTFEFKFDGANQASTQGNPTTNKPVLPEGIHRAIVHDFFISSKKKVPTASFRLLSDELFNEQIPVYFDIFPSGDEKREKRSQELLGAFLSLLEAPFNITDEERVIGKDTLKKTLYRVLNVHLKTFKRKDGSEFTSIAGFSKKD